MSQMRRTILPVAAAVLLFGSAGVCGQYHQEELRLLKKIFELRTAAERSGQPDFLLRRLDILEGEINRGLNTEEALRELSKKIQSFPGAVDEPVPTAASYGPERSGPADLGHPREIEFINSQRRLAGDRMNAGDPAHAAEVVRGILSSPVGSSVFQTTDDVADFLSFLELCIDMNIYDNVERMSEMVIEVSRSRKFFYPPNTIRALRILARVHERGGRPEESAASLKEAIHLIESMMGQRHPNLFQCLHDLGALYDRQKRMPEAEEVFLRALKISKNVRGSYDGGIADVLNALGTIRLMKGSYVDAEKFLNEALKIRMKECGLEDYHTIMVLHNLSILRIQQGNYVDAVRRTKEVLLLREKVLGTDHPEVAGTLVNLAGLTLNNGNRSEAKRLYLRARGICLKNPPGKVSEMMGMIDSALDEISKSK